MTLLGLRDGAVLDVAEAPSRRRIWAPSALRGEGTAARRAWRGWYVRRLIALDAVSALLAAAAAHFLRFGADGGALGSASTTPLLIFILPIVWVGAMLGARTYEERFLWVGPEEFRRVFVAAAMLLATVGTMSWAFKLDVARGFVVLALPLAALLTLSHRLVQRRWLHRQRARGRFLQTAILVGHYSGVSSLREQIQRDSGHGYRVIGCCLPASGDGPSVTFDDLPVLGGLDEVAAVVKRYEVDTVAVLPSPDLEGARLRTLGWELEDTDAELLLAPAITEVAGPRINIRPVSGLPLLHMSRPEFTGARRVVKNLFDRTAAAFGILLLLPLLIGLAIAVKVTDGGSVFFRHERIGKRGQPFSVFKFRTMVEGADKIEQQLFDQNEGNDVQFKMRRDPRVTRVGAIMRKYSLDELPQLFNVLNGSMSLVGPRPHVTREVELYGDDMRRRLLVKPGITGLWQVSGRSDLSWDESVRIDVRYVENWSLSMDLTILFRTVGAVLHGSGAY